MNVTHQYSDLKYYKTCLIHRQWMLFGSSLGWLMLPNAIMTGNAVDIVCGLVIAIGSFMVYLILRTIEYTPPSIAYVPFEKLSRFGRGQYVYVIRDIDVTGHYKIGRTTDIVRRLTDFNVKLPFQIGIVLIATCTDAVVLETKLHHHFAEKRVAGEWFSLVDEDVIELIDMIARHGKIVGSAKMQESA